MGLPRFQSATILEVKGVSAISFLIFVCNGE